jgi:hypothetical protein
MYRHSTDRFYSPGRPIARPFFFGKDRVSAIRSSSVRRARLGVLRLWVTIESGHVRPGSRSGAATVLGGERHDVGHHRDPEPGGQVLRQHPQVGHLDEHALTSWRWLPASVGRRDWVRSVAAVRYRSGRVETTPGRFLM